MLLRDVIAHEKARLAHPWIWMPTAGLGVAIALSDLPLMLRLSTGTHPASWLVTLIGAFTLPALILWLSPAPWLWTGGRASHAPFLRGLLQSALFGTGVLMLAGACQVLLIFAFGLQGHPLMPLRVVATGLLQWVPAAMLTGHFFILWERTRNAKQEADKRLREAQWVLLRGQLSPHVLFNSLNALAEMVRQDPLAAEQAILDLAELYRSLLAHGQKPLAPLEAERKLLARYLGLEQIRLGDRLKVGWDWEAGLEEIQVPPFLVQPLVENALKHGVAPFPAGGEIRIEARREGAGLLIKVSNTGRPLPLVVGNGVGVRNLEARLYLAYGDKAAFRLHMEDGWTVAEIRLNELEERKSR